MRAMRWVAAIALFASACSPSYTARYAPVDSDGKQLRDSEGRTRVFRGVNVHIDGIFDVTFSDGRAPREPLPGFDASDPAEMKRLGFNLVRLPINWSAVEPQKGQFSTEYLDKVQGIVDLCRAQGVLVIIDLHEDGFSKEICEDGAPLWAIEPPPPVIPGGPVPGPDCHTAPAALAAFDSFFNNVDGLEDAYVDMLVQVVTRFRDDEDVLGFEIMNEPIGTDDVVGAFHDKAAKAMRAVDAKHLVLFEPVATRNFTNAAPLSATPFSVGGAVYAPHIYTAIFGDNMALTDGSYPRLLQGSINAARDEADSWATPLLVTEFGLGSTLAQGPEWIGHFLDDADAVLASWTWWLWRDPAVGGWGLFDPNPDGTYTERPALVGALSRPYAQAIGGDAESVAWDGATLTVKLRGRAGVPSRSDVFWDRGTPAIACDGRSVTANSVDQAGSVYVVDCGGCGEHTLTFAMQ
jgi:endoglycosylceramidase